MSSAAPASPRPAATLVIYRAGGTSAAPELLMVERSAAMRFAGGATVFPGGAVDAGDRVLAARLRGGDGTLAGDLAALPGDDDDLAARIAAVRETLEETGIAIGLIGPRDGGEIAAARAMLADPDGAGAGLGAVLERFGWRLDPAALIPFARWRPEHPRAFDTRFYLAELAADAPGGDTPEPDGSENARAFWSSAAAMLAAADAGAARLIFPTRRNLERLAACGDFGSACADAARHDPAAAITPWVEDGWLTIPADIGYPVVRERLTTAQRG